eukprot:355983-Chlamydomonas_euryale.AAC.2
MGWALTLASQFAHATSVSLSFLAGHCRLAGSQRHMPPVSRARDVACAPTAAFVHDVACTPT